jgi:FkbM family methyltransferase
LKKPLEPADVYDPIECKRSKSLVNTSIMFCVHARVNGWISDYTSRLFLQTGIREPENVEIFLKYLKENPDWFVIDIGAHLGLYTLFGASVGRQVLAVEPFYDSNIRLHKAAQLTGRAEYITLITNAVSDKSNEIKTLQKHSNIGQQYISNDKTYDLNYKNSLPQHEAKYYVSTIVLDDLVDYIPLNKNNQRYQKAIMKIDCEAHEPYVFQRASQLFDQVDVCVILMEWEHVKNRNYAHNERDKMLRFLYSKGFVSYDLNGNVLDRGNYKTWTFDIIWKRLDC